MDYTPKEWRETDGKRCETAGDGEHPAAALSTLPRGKNLSRLNLPRVPEDV